MKTLCDCLRALVKVVVHASSPHTHCICLITCDENRVPRMMLSGAPELRVLVEKTKRPCRPADTRQTDIKWSSPSASGACWARHLSGLSRAEDRARGAPGSQTKDVRVRAPFGGPCCFSCQLATWRRQTSVMLTFRRYLFGDKAFKHVKALVSYYYLQTTW